MKKIYESPKVFKLDETASALGELDCDIGSGAGSCGNGQAAIGACAQLGSNAGTPCSIDGSNPQQQCGAQGSGK